MTDEEILQKLECETGIKWAENWPQSDGSHDECLQPSAPNAGKGRKNYD